LKKDQNTITVSTQTSDISTNSENPGNKSKPAKPKAQGALQKTLRFIKSPKKASSRKLSPPRIPKKTVMDFHRKVDEAYVQEEFPIMGILLDKMNEDLRKRFNQKKVERFLQTSMKQFLRSSPDHLWSSVYRPLGPNEV